jgi:hypothetical protein
LDVDKRTYVVTSFEGSYLGNLLLFHSSAVEEVAAKSLSPVVKTNSVPELAKPDLS